jgi:tetratricopeptide (TPR) repeat protein
MLWLSRQTDDEAGFSHALIQEVAYTGLPRAQRRELHGQIVHAIKRIEADRLSEQAETLVYHAARGEVWDELAVAAGVAGRRAASRSAYVEAAVFFRQGIEACERLSRSEETLAREIDLRFELRSSLFPTAGIDRSLENSTQAECLARQLGDKRRLGWATAYLAKDLQLVGRPGAALVAAARALEFSEDDPELTIAAQYFAGQAAYSRGDYISAVNTLRTLISTLEARDGAAWTGTPGPSIIFFRAWLIWSLARLGENLEAEATAGEMRRLADEADLPLCRTIAHLSEGFALAFAGRMPEAEATLRVGLSLCRKWELFAWSTNISSCLGHVLSHLGQFDEAFELLDHAAEQTRRSGILVSHANELAWLAEAHRLAGHADRAAHQAEESVKVARAHEERGNEALATVVLGEALADLGSFVAGQAHWVTALRLAIDIGMAPLIQRCRANLEARDHPVFV